MASKRKAKAQATASADVRQEGPLQAVILADSFNEKFRPITLDMPRCLLPVANVPILDYTLQFLVTAGVGEIFILCKSHAEKIEAHIKSSKFGRSKDLNVEAINLPMCLSAGDALREVDARSLISNDFILVSGDVVSNVKLDNILRIHRERRQADRNAIMTLVFKRAGPCHRTRSQEEDTVVAMNAQTNRVVHFENDASSPTVEIEPALFDEHSDVRVHADLLDCHIDICSPDVPMLFTDNFDYQTLREDFLRGMLNPEIMSYKIYGHIISNEYAARVQCLRTYSAVNKDIIHRWTFPLVPDENVWYDSSYRYQRNQIYLEKDVRLSRSADIVEDTVVGAGTQIAEGATITRSVIGRNCNIGKNVKMTGSFVWDNVTIEDGCVLKECLIANGAVVKKDAIINRGCVVSYGVVIGPGFPLPEFTKVTVNTKVFRARREDWGDEPVEISKTPEAGSATSWSESDVGPGGVGRIWEEDPAEARKNTIAKMPMVIDDGEMSTSTVPGEGEGEEEEDAAATEDRFVHEIIDLIAHSNSQPHDVDNLKTEINGLKYAYDRTFGDCTAALVPAILALVDVSNFLPSLKKVLARWLPVIGLYRQEAQEDQIELIMTILEYCVENEPFFKAFAALLQLFYEGDCIDDEAVLAWAETADDAEGRERVLFDQAKKFVDYLKEGDEDDEEGEDEEEEDDE